MLTHRELLERAVKRQGDDTALIDILEGRTYTYQEFNNVVNRFANALRDKGVRKGDRVAFILYNTIEFPITLYAIYKIGAVPVPVNYMLAEDNFTYIFDDMSPTFVVYDEEVRDSVVPAIETSSTDPNQICVGCEPEKGKSFSKFRGTGGKQRPPDIPTKPDDPAYILYTSGTTGAPKGVTFTTDTAFARAQEGVIDVGLTQESIALQASPWFHAGGIDLTVHPTFAVGGTLVATKNWDPEIVADSIENHGITHIVGVPTVAQRIANMEGADERDFDSVQCMMCMGSPLSETLAENLMENFTSNIYNGYGTTETLLDSVLRSGSLPEHAGTVGRPSPDKRVRVVEFNQEETANPDETVSAGEEGEVITRGGPNLDYYYGNQESTNQSIRNGWYYTGDLGFINEDGYLTITGRVDDMILSGGELVSPIEVEEVLERHEGVASAIVVGTPDEEWGNVVTAYVNTDNDLTEDELDEFCREHKGLADYKRPRIYEFVDSIERTATGKKQRYKYRE